MKRRSRLRYTENLSQVIQPISARLGTGIQLWPTFPPPVYYYSRQLQIIISPSGFSHYITVESLSSVQSFSHVQHFATPWIAACQASLSITNSRSLPKLMSIEPMMPSNHLILCHPLLLLPSIFPSIRVFSNESTLCIRWPKYWSFSFNIPDFSHRESETSLETRCIHLQCQGVGTC